MKMQEIPSKKTFLTAYIFMINFVLGSGVLALPYAFQKAGIILSVGFMIIVTVLAYMTMCWLFEVQSRLQCLNYAFTMKWLDFVSDESSATEDSPRVRRVSVSTPALTPDDTRMSTFTQNLINGDKKTMQRNPYTLNQVVPDDAFDLDGKKIRDIKDLVHVFGGPKWASLWDVFQVFYIYTAMWMYCAVWSSSLLVAIPIPTLTSRLECNPQGSETFTPNCQRGYQIFCGVFGVLIGILSVMKIPHMDKIQTFLTVLAYTCLTIMVTTIWIAMARQPYEDKTWVTPTMIDFGSFESIFAAALFAQLCHMGCPTITREVPKMKSAKSVFAAGFASTCFIYVILGVTAAWYFGPDTVQVVTMNWKNYNMESSGVTSIGATIISTTIIVFPVFTTTAAYVLNTQLLAYTLETMTPLRWRQRFSRVFRAECMPSTSSVPVTLATRFIAHTPPVVCAVFDRQVSSVLMIAGCAGFVLMFFAPCFLQIRSHQVLSRLQLRSRTIYDGPLSGIWTAWALLTLMTVGFGYYIYSAVT